LVELNFLFFSCVCVCIYIYIYASNKLAESCVVLKLIYMYIFYNIFSQTATQRNAKCFFTVWATMVVQVGELFCERVQHPKKWLIRLTLYLLSTWIGTFILCGLPSISPSFPYFLRFSQISQSKREQIVFSWATSFFYLLRMLFKSIKLVIPLVFFSQVYNYMHF